MSDLRTNIAAYANDLTALLADHSDDSALLKAAYDAYGENDPRYRVLSYLNASTKKGGFGAYTDDDKRPPNQTVD